MIEMEDGRCRMYDVGRRESEKSLFNILKKSNDYGKGKWRSNAD